MYMKIIELNKKSETNILAENLAIEASILKHGIVSGVVGFKIILSLSSKRGGGPWERTSKRELLAMKVDRPIRSKSSRRKKGKKL